MGEIHKFKRPPKNQQQFRGYRPQSQPFGAGKPARRRMPDWLRTTLAWLGLIVVATGFWGVGALLG